MKRIKAVLLLLMFVVFTTLSCNGVISFTAKDKISLPFIASSKLGQIKVKSNVQSEGVSIAGSYIYSEDTEIDGRQVVIYSGIEFLEDGSLNSYYASSWEQDDNGNVIWYKDADGGVWGINYIVGTIPDGSSEKNVLMLCDIKNDKIIGALYYQIQGDKLIFSDGSEGGMEFVKGEKEVFKNAIDPAADFYGSGTEEDPYVIGWVNVSNAYLKDNLEGCFVCNDFDFDNTGASLIYGVKFELLKDDDNKVVGSKFYQYFTRDDFKDSDDNYVYSYSFDNPDNKGLLCKFKERKVGGKEVINLIMWENSYNDECCGQLPIYFDVDSSNNIEGFWIDSCFGDWASRNGHDSDNQSYFYHYVKSNDNTIFDGAFDYMDYIKGDKKSF